MPTAIPPPVLAGSSARLLGEVVPIPDGVNEQFQGYYRYGRTGKF